MPKFYCRELAELIFVNPYCRISNVVEANSAKRQTAAIYLKALAAENILEERSGPQFSDSVVRWNLRQ